jgi:hypothetical protein
VSVTVFNVRDIIAGPTTALAAASGPRQRTMLRNFMRHGMLEVAGRWHEILTPEMVVDWPRYRIFEGGQQHELEGPDQIGSFYAELTRQGLNVFGPLDETVFVSDWGLAIESLMGSHLTGEQAVAIGYPQADRGEFYQLTRYISSFWPYAEDCRLIGEHIYENTGSRHLDRITKAQYVSPEAARDQLADLIEKSRDWSRELT